MKNFTTTINSKGIVLEPISTEVKFDSFTSDEVTELQEMYSDKISMFKKDNGEYIICFKLDNGGILKINRNTEIKSGKLKLNFTLHPTEIPYFTFNGDMERNLNNIFKLNKSKIDKYIERYNEINNRIIEINKEVFNKLDEYMKDAKENGFIHFAQGSNLTKSLIKFNMFSYQYGGFYITYNLVTNEITYSENNLYKKSPLVGYNSFVKLVELGEIPTYVRMFEIEPNENLFYDALSDIVALFPTKGEFIYQCKLGDKNILRLKQGYFYNNHDTLSSYNLNKYFSIEELFDIRLALIEYLKKF